MPTRFLESTKVTPMQSPMLSAVPCPTPEKNSEDTLSDLSLSEEKERRESPVSFLFPQVYKTMLYHSNPDDIIPMDIFIDGDDSVKKANFLMNKLIIPEKTNWLKK